MVKLVVASQQLLVRGPELAFMDGVQDINRHDLSVSDRLTYSITLCELQDVPFIKSPHAVHLSNSSLASAGTCRDSRCGRGEVKRGTFILTFKRQW